MPHRASRPRSLTTLVLAALLAALIVSPTTAVASTPERGPIDQQQPESPFEAGGLSRFTDLVGGFMQGVVPGVTAWEVVSLAMFSTRPDPQPVQLEIRDGAPDGPVLASASAIAPATSSEGAPWVDFTFSPPVSVVPGSIVYLYLEVDDRAVWGHVRRDAYPDGDSYLACGASHPVTPRPITDLTHDFAFVTFAPASAPGDPGTPGDRDGDGVGDDRDPDLVGDVVRASPDAAFAAPGHRTALLSRLAEIEERVAAGDDAGAIGELHNLRRRIDGCGSTADRDDWVTDCAAQRDVRAGVDELIVNLGG